jgi:hypothetical protein
MSRRPLVLLALAVSSFVLAACSDVTSPTTKGEACSGYIDQAGNCQARN